MKNGWIALFSQTGTEILNISKRLSRFPDVCVTNNSLSNINRDLIEIYRNDDTKTLVTVPTALTSEIYNLVLGKIKKPLITLNGWLKIVPEEICNKYTIYNGHPGLITEFPELKGKDPVHRVFKDRKKYPTVGAVIHKVVPEVDAGEIVMSKGIDNTFETFDEMNSAVRDISLDLWVEFLKSNPIFKK